MGKSYSISSADLEKYVDSDPQEVSYLADWMQLQSQLHVDGLSNLYEKLKEPGVTLDKIREDCSAGLLRDLEKASKIPNIKALEDGRELGLVFKPEFHDELGKSVGERSPAYREFIEACSEHFIPKRHTVEKVSAEALEALDDPEMDLGSFKAKVKAGISEYKQACEEQVKKDLDRSVVLYKGKGGEMHHSTFAEFADQDWELTGQQKDFVKTCWQQGSFMSGWFSTMCSYALEDKHDQERVLMPSGVNDRTSIFIDASGGEVKIYNRLKQLVVDVQGVGSAAEAVLTVDITDLKGDEFIPGCAEKPKMQFDIQGLDESIGLKVPEGLTCAQSEMAPGEHMEVSEYVKKEVSKEYLKMMQGQDHEMQNRGRKSLESLLGVDEVLNGLRGGRSALDEKAIKAVKEIGVKVAEVTEDFDEGKRKTLENNLAKIIRRSAREEGKAMSWGQFAQSLGDRIMDSISATFSWSQKSKTQKIIEGHPDIVQVIKGALSSKKQGEKPLVHREQQSGRLRG